MPPEAPGLLVCLEERFFSCMPPHSMVRYGCGTRAACGVRYVGSRPAVRRPARGVCCARFGRHNVLAHGRARFSAQGLTHSSISHTPPFSNAGIRSAPSGHQSMSTQQDIDEGAIKAAFDRFDTDGNGCVTVWRVACSSPAPFPPFVTQTLRTNVACAARSPAKSSSAS